MLRIAGNPHFPFTGPRFPVRLESGQGERMGNAMEILKLEHVSKSFGGVKAVRDLSLSLREGEIFGFLGTNGAGKTTTLKMALGFIAPDPGGRVSVFGASPEDPSTRERIGFMPETAYYYPFLTARELLRFYGGVCGLDAGTVRSRSEKLLRRVGLEKAADRQLKTYSKGMLQRAGIAQALLGDPGLLVLDEPLTGLDPLARIHFRDLLLELKTQGKTILFSSHDLSEAELICDRVAILKEGRLLMQDKLSAIAGDGGLNLERAFLACLSRPAPAIEDEPQPETASLPQPGARPVDAPIAWGGFRAAVRRLGALASLSLLDLWRRKDMIVVFLLSALILAPLFVFAPFGLSGAERYVNELALLLIWIFSFAVGLGVSARLFPPEFEHRTIYPLLAKPVSRGTVLAGKLLGGIAASWTALAALYVAFALLAGFRGGGWFPGVWWQALLLHAAGMVVLCGLSLCGSLLLTASANLTLCALASAGMLLCGARLPSLIASQPAPADNFLWLVNFLGPHMEFFDLRQRLVHGWDPIPWYVCLAAWGYAVCYAGACLAAAAALFRRKKL